MTDFIMKFLKKNSIVVIFLFGSILNSLPLMASVKDIVVNNLSLVNEGKDLFVLIYSLYFVKLLVAAFDTLPFYLAVNFFNKYLHIDSSKDY